MRVILTLLLTAGVALANGPPPPVKDKKWVKVEVEVQIEKGVTGYVFYEQGFRLDFKGPLHLPLRKVEFDDKKPTPIPSDVTRRYTRLFAVPESAVKEFKSEKELEEAIRNQKVKGVLSTELSGVTTIDQKAEDDKVTWRYTVTRIDDKGITVKITGDGQKEPAKQPPPKNPLALAEPGTLIGGIAAALAVAFGGLWLARRRK